MNIIHITDLDGTLLNTIGQLDGAARRTISQLIASGHLFTIATARSPLSVNRIFEDIPLQLPMILLNGALLLDSNGQTILADNPLTYEEKSKLLETEQKFGITGFKCLSVNGQLRYSLPFASLTWDRFIHSNGLQLDQSLIIDASQVEDPKTAILYVYYADDHASRLNQLNQSFLGDCDLATDFYQDRYLPDAWFLELFSHRTAKGTFVPQLMEHSRADLSVAYGDSSNDLSLFATVDFSCAVANATVTVKRAAHRIIGSNEENGVPTFIEEGLWRDLNALR